MIHIEFITFHFHILLLTNIIKEPIETISVISKLAIDEYLSGFFFNKLLPFEFCILNICLKLRHKCPHSFYGKRHSKNIDIKDYCYKWNGIKNVL